MSCLINHISVCTRT